MRLWFFAGCLFVMAMIGQAVHAHHAGWSLEFFSGSSISKWEEVTGTKPPKDFVEGMAFFSINRIQRIHHWCTVFMPLKEGQQDDAAEMTLSQIAAFEQLMMTCINEIKADRKRNEVQV